MIESGRRHRRKQGMEYNEQAFKEKSQFKGNESMAGFDCDYDTVIRKRPFQGNLYGDAVCCFSGYGVGAVCNRTADVEVKGRATPYYKDVLALGYGFFYAYVVCITDSATAYAYILPLTSMLILFKDRSYMIRCAVTNEIVIVLSALLHVFLGLNPNVKMTDYYLQFFNAASVLYLLRSFCRPLK